MTIVRELDELETYQQCLRALKRLRSKRLICGPEWKRGVVCAIGALNAHNRHAGELRFISEDLAAIFSSNRTARFMGNCSAEITTIDVNEKFRPKDNSMAAQKARYRYVYGWLEAKIAELSKTEAAA